MISNELHVIGIGDNVADNYQHTRTFYPGGNCLNFSVYAKMLGCEAAYLGVFGSDSKAHHIQSVLRNERIDFSHCLVVDGPNGEAILTVENGERKFISSNKGGVSKSVPMSFALNDHSYLESFALIHTSAYSYMDTYLPQLKGMKPIISYDFSDDFDRTRAIDLCQYVDIGFFSCSEWDEDTTKSLLKDAVKGGCKLALASRGSNEAFLLEGENWYQQIPRPIQPVDTLGAGDAFITAFLIAYLCEKDRESCLDKAVQFASEICMVKGAFGHGKTY